MNAMYMIATSAKNNALGASGGSYRAGRLAVVGRLTVVVLLLLTTTGCKSWDAIRAAIESGAIRSSAVPDNTAAQLHVGPNQAYDSITAAVSAADAGDWIVIHGREQPYRESLGTKRGDIGKPLHFIAAAGQRPVISGADKITSWSREGAYWVHQYANDLFEFELPVGDNIIPDQISAAHPGAGLLEQVFVDGIPLTQRLSLADVDKPTVFFC